MPRSVPRAALTESFTWTNRVGRPCAANSRSQNARAKNPRSSPCRSRSTTNAPGSSVSLKIIAGIPQSREPLEAPLQRAEPDEPVALEVDAREAVREHLAVQ